MLGISELLHFAFLFSIPTIVYAAKRELHLDESNWPVPTDEDPFARDSPLAQQFQTKVVVPVGQTEHRKPQKAEIASKRRQPNVRLNDCLIMVRDFQSIGRLDPMMGIGKGARRVLHCLHECLATDDETERPTVVGSCFRRIHTASHRNLKEPLTQRDDPPVEECFSRHSGKVLIGLVDELIEDVHQRDQCERLCYNEELKSRGSCRSAAYYSKERECILTAESRHSMPDLFVDDPNSTYLENRCAQNQTDENTTAVSASTAAPLATTTRAPTTTHRIRIANTAKPSTNQQPSGKLITTTPKPSTSTAKSDDLKSTGVQAKNSIDSPNENSNSTETPKPLAVTEKSKGTKKVSETQNSSTAVSTSTSSSLSLSTTSTANHGNNESTSQPALIEYENHGNHSNATADLDPYSNIGHKPSLNAEQNSTTDPYSSIGHKGEANATEAHVEPGGYGDSAKQEPSRPTTIPPNTISTTKRPTPTSTNDLPKSHVPAHVVDNYGMPFKPVENGLNIRYKDHPMDKMAECFIEFYPPNVKTNVIFRVHSIEECINECRRCRNCVKGSSCDIVGYSVEREICALAKGQRLRQLRRDQSMGSFIFLHRTVCA